MSGHAAGMTEHVTPVLPPAVERRAEPREPEFANLWMVDPQGTTVLRCRCIDRSASGMRLRVPLGYGVHEGQRYELSSHPPGSQSAPGLGLRVSRRASVAWTKIVLDGGEDHLDLGVQLDPDETVFTGPSSFPSA